MARRFKREKRRIKKPSRTWIALEKDLKISAVNACKKYYKKGMLTVDLVPGYDYIIIIVVGGRKIYSTPLKKLSFELGLPEAWQFLKENGGKHINNKKQEFFQPISYSQYTDDLIKSGYFD